MFVFINVKIVADNFKLKWGHIIEADIKYADINDATIEQLQAETIAATKITADKITSGTLKSTVSLNVGSKFKVNASSGILTTTADAQFESSVYFLYDPFIYVKSQQKYMTLAQYIA